MCSGIAEKGVVGGMLFGQTNFLNKKGTSYSKTLNKDYYIICLLFKTIDVLLQRYPCCYQESYKALMSSLDATDSIMLFVSDVVDVELGLG